MAKILFRIIGVMLFCSATTFAGSDVYLSLSAHGSRVNLGLSNFNPQSPSSAEVTFARQIMEVIRYDILFSRYFNVIEDGPAFTGTEANAKDWLGRGAEILVTGDIKVKDNDITLLCKLMDIESRQAIWQKEYKVKAADCRSLGHIINDEIIFRFTGERGIAHSRIVFANRGGAGGKEIYIIDYDGSALRKLTSGASINMFPRWSPDGKEIIFTTFLYGNPDLYSISPDGGGMRPVSYRQGLNATGSFSTDGTNLAVTLSLGKDPSLYLLDRSGKILKQLTFDKGIETSPTFSPNGKELAFISDKPGFPQVYVMNIEGGNQRRLSAKGYCDSPAWSPRGDKIAFAMREGRRNYDIYVYDLASTSFDKLTQDDGNNQNPSWSPDGRFLVFASNRSGKSELYIIGADGSGARKLGKITGESTMPWWGP